MNNGCFQQALKRREARPDIHFPVKLKRGAKNDAAISVVSAMIFDLRSEVPELSMRQLSSLVGISDRVVRDIVGQIEPSEEWTSDDNEASAAAELSVLTLHHPYRPYEDHPDAEHEFRGLPVVLSAPPHSDPHRRADQSHAVKRPITLATEPFDWRAAA